MRTARTIETHYIDHQPGDGWTLCSNGHRHWGTAGAVGVQAFYRDETGAYRYMLVKRSRWIHNPGLWSTPSGALMPGEAPVVGATREANEEGLGALLELGYVTEVVRGGCAEWPFYTVYVRVPFAPFLPTFGDEHDDLDWVTKAEAEQFLALHPGLVLPV
jgi:8-oxo-dGTP pyrophosphatase MutT (NUDIX family)